jgi:hypothetical protein
LSAPCRTSGVELSDFRQRCRLKLVEADAPHVASREPDNNLVTAIRDDFTRHSPVEIDAGDQARLNRIVSRDHEYSVYAVYVECKESLVTIARVVFD